MKLIIFSKEHIHRMWKHSAWIFRSIVLTVNTLFTLHIDTTEQMNNFRTFIYISRGLVAYMQATHREVPGSKFRCRKIFFFSFRKFFFDQNGNYYFLYDNKSISCNSSCKKIVFIPTGINAIICSLYLCQLAQISIRLVTILFNVIIIICRYFYQNIPSIFLYIEEYLFIYFFCYAQKCVNACCESQLVICFELISLENWCGKN